MNTIKPLALSLLRLDGGTQSRSEISQQTVNEYTEAMEGGSIFPPVKVFHDGNYYYLVDGFHRYFANKNLKKSSIEAEIIIGTQREAIIYSFSVNNLHGLRPTNADKRKAVIIMLEDFEWSDYKNVEIARICGVSAAYVGKLRTELAAKKEPAKEKPVKEKPVLDKPEFVAEIPVVEKPEVDHHDEMTDALVQENERLNERLAVAAMDATEEEKQSAQELITALREEIRQLMIELTSVKISRDSYQRDNVQLKKQCAMYQKQLKKL